MSIRQWFRREVLEQRAYGADVPDCRIKLDANENPFTLPPPLQAELRERLGTVLPNRYPEAGAARLRQRYAERWGVDADRVMIGNGSDELIQILCTALAVPGADLLVPVPTFAMYRITGLNNGYRVREAPLDGAFDLDIGAMAGIIAEKTPALTFLSYPNNPTGNCFSANRVEALLERSRGIVVVDEAYGHFSGRTFLHLADRYENLIILRTLSKAGFAAMRIGFLIGRPEVVAELDKVRLPYNLNALSQIAAGFFLDHEPVFAGQIGEILRERDRLVESLGRIDGVRPLPTDANFVFFSCTIDADEVYRQILQRGILVKPFRFPGREQTYIRVTVGRREENEAFIEALKSVTAK